MSFREHPGASDTASEPTAPTTADPAAPPAAEPFPPGTAQPAAEAESTTAARGRSGGSNGLNMLPERESRRFGLERLLVRLVATCGIVGIGVALGAILRSSNVQGWIIGLVVALVSVILSAVLWSSRQV